jgi:XTP/dITP diphosphohydrolase
MSTVVLASGNRGKLIELQQALKDTHFTLVPQGELGVTDAIEDGITFLENALIKARHAARLTGKPALADDSGLVVPALGGAPGIYSSRYSGKGDKGNNDKLLAAMAGYQGEQRRAWFICVLVFLISADDPAPIVAEGRWHGFIAEGARGQGGFGYDPVFVIDEQGRTAAELAAHEKQVLSHRGQAIAALRAKLGA